VAQSLRLGSGEGSLHIRPIYTLSHPEPMGISSNLNLNSQMKLRPLLTSLYTVDLKESLTLKKTLLSFLIDISSVLSVNKNHKLDISNN